MAWEFLLGMTHCFLEVDFSVLWEEDREAGFFSEGASDIVLALEGGNLPLVNVLRVPPMIAG